MDQLKMAALAFCAQRPLFYENLRRVLQRPTTQILAASQEGVALFDPPSHTCMAAVTSEAQAEPIARAFGEESDLFTAQGPGMMRALVGRFAEHIVSRYGKMDVQSYRQPVFTGTQAPKVNPDFDIRPMEMEQAAWAASHYSAMPGDVPYMEKCIRTGPMLVAYVDGQPAGFIGWHPEGSMGLLEVLPEFRRHGVGRALEAAAIGLDLSRGNRPYAHVHTDNTPSLDLQKKLGLSWEDDVLYWIT